MGLITLCENRRPLTLPGAASLLRAHERCKMFGDLAEQEHVFSLLDEWAKCEYDLDLTYITGRKSNFNKEITKVIEAVQNEEQKTIKKNPKRKLGFSFQSELLGKLLYSLTEANTPAKLLASLPIIKILLLQAMIISVEIKYDKLELINADIKPDAEIGKKRKKQVINWAKKGSEAVKKYNEKDKASWLKTANDLRVKNPKLSFRSIATNINKNDEKRPPIETIRKYIAKQLGKAL